MNKFIFDILPNQSRIERTSEAYLELSNACAFF